MGGCGWPASQPSQSPRKDKKIKENCKYCVFNRKQKYVRMQKKQNIIGWLSTGALPWLWMAGKAAQTEFQKGKKATKKNAIHLVVFNTRKNRNKLSEDAKKGK